MAFEKTYFPYFRNYCVEKFGADMGDIILTEAESNLSNMIMEADYKYNKYIKWHMEINMLPSIAIYLAFRKIEHTAQKAYELTDEVLQIAREKNKMKNQLIGKLPFGYTGFKLLCKSIVAKEYPTEGWDLEWIRYDKDEIQFNMKSCIYFETTKVYNCAEMCPLFCANDDVILGAFKPAIVFERNGTIALGQEVCDFHFKNGKRRRNL